MARRRTTRDKTLQRALERVRKHPDLGTYEDPSARRAFVRGSVPPPNPNELPPEESFIEGAMALFAEHVDKTGTSLLLQLDDVLVKTRGLTRTVSFRVLANCPTELAEPVGNHPIVRAPLKAFLEDMRARYPGVTMKIALAFDPDDTGLGAAASLKIALKLAGAKDLIKSLRL